MWIPTIASLQSGAIYFFARGAGVYSNLPSSGIPTEGPLGFMIYILLGSACGLIGGLVLLPVVRYIHFMMGKKFKGGGWAIFTTTIGAVVFAILAMKD